MLTETLDRLFGELCSHEVVQAAEADGGAPELWQAFAEAGFARISVPEAAGGSGGTLLDALEVLRLVGWHAAPMPAADTSVLGGWLLAGAGLPVPSGPLAVPAAAEVEVAPAEAGTRSAEPAAVTLSGTARGVPWARTADRIVMLVDAEPARPLVVSVDPTEAASVAARRNLAGEPRDTLAFDAAPALAAPAPPGIDHDALALRGALSRVALMAGAMDRMSRLTVDYTNERVQFGRPVARFQAVQQHLVWAAQDAALTKMSAHCAGRAAQRAEDAGSRPGAVFEIAAAKLVANQAAARATKACHQAHGAMGMTQEYPLHHLSRRLWSWRMEYGGEAEWAKRIGAVAVDRGADGLYPLITAGTAAG
ncbi:MAG TPA: acyl-CoA dehydrogenase [Acidimicrobiaceae bacterium]|nr:acyl-CoA dehydrogenase [Acidimicrobiaceae bacterium]